MKKLLLTSIAIAICLFGCQKDSTVEPAETQQSTPDQYFAPIDLENLSSRNSCPWTVVPAGSVDALADAIENTCDDGVIYLKAGMHTENHALTITKPVKIIGETGAVLRIKSELTPADPATGSFPINPALHVLNAPGFLLQDVELQPSGTDGGGALLLENSHQSGVMRCKFNNFQYNIMVQKSDRMTVMFNTIVANGAWQTGGPNTYGIVIINGKSAYVSDNDVSNALFGIWACDRWGTAERNFTHGNYIGLILCNVPPALQFPDGFIGGSEIPATGWKARNNKSTGNFNIGYLVIDGANNNLLENNNASGNGAYDMELTTDTYRFGFLTPAAYSNTVNTGNYPNITIKNCGPNNTVNGGVLVDTGVDPCN